MKAYISIFKNPDEIEVRALANGDDGLKGDALRVVKPGGSIGGLSYERLLEHGDGEIELERFS